MPDRGELIGGATVWDDLNFPIIPRSTGATIAAYTAIDAGGVLWMLQAHLELDSLGSSAVSSK